MKNAINRKDFIKSLTLSSAGMSLIGNPFFSGRIPEKESVPVGMIGLDTSHCPAFTRLINVPDKEKPELSGFRVVAAYPYGSREIESSYSRIPRYTKEVQELGVEIVDSIDDLLTRVDVVLLMTNDGNPRREQALQVIQAKKPMFIEKPMAASLQDVAAIMDAAKQYNTPIFSSSTRRYIKEAQAVRNENITGEVQGAITYSPATLEDSHPDLFWYGIHGVEVLFTVMGAGCESVTRFKSDDADIVVGTWKDGRFGTFRGIRDGEKGVGGTVFGTEKILPFESFDGHGPLVGNILEFFRTEIPPVDLDETLQIYAFMEAADESKRRGGAAATLKEVLSAV